MQVGFTFRGNCSTCNLWNIGDVDAFGRRGQVKFALLKRELLFFSFENPKSLRPLPSNFLPYKCFYSNRAEELTLERLVFIIWCRSSLGLTMSTALQSLFPSQGDRVYLRSDTLYMVACLSVLPKPKSDTFHSSDSSQVEQHMHLDHHGPPRKRFVLRLQISPFRVKIYLLFVTSG